MTDWLDDEADENKREEDEERRRKELLRRSNYWAAIIQHMGQVVERINNHKDWKEKLAGLPLRFNQPFGENGYRVAKSGYPAVSVTIEHKADHILVTRWFFENPLQRDFKPTEKLRIGTAGDSVVLQTDKNETLVVPEDAVRYFLKAVIESLKITKSAP